jgi:6-phosphogluconolactonase
MSAKVQHRGQGPNARRQEGPHAHGIALDPQAGRAYVADLGPIIDRFFAEHTVEALTVTPADFRTSIERAVAAAGSGA